MSQPNDLWMIVCLHPHRCMEPLQIIILWFIPLINLIKSAPVALHFTFGLTIVNAFAPKRAGLVVRVVGQAHVAIHSFLNAEEFCLGEDKQPEVRCALELLLLLSDGSSLQADEVYHVILLTHQKDPSVWDHLGSIHPDFDGKPAAFSSFVKVDDWISPSSMPIPQNSYERVLESGK